MDTPTRRALLAGSAGTLALLGAGCLDDAGTSEPDGGSSDENDDGGDDGEQTRDDDRITEDPRVDEPPHEIDAPESPADPDDEWNDHYLGEHIEGEPSLEFEVVHGVALEEPTLTGDLEFESPDEESTGDEPVGDEASDADDSVTDPAEEPPTDSPSESEPEPAPVDGEFAVHLLEDDADLEGLSLDRVGEEDRATLEAVDLDEQVVVLVESGWGSSSVRHQWVRVEGPDDDGAIDLHGYYTDPEVQTQDYTTRHSAVVVDRPDEDVALARARLTVSEDHRVNVNSTEGVVSLEQES